MMKMNKLTFTKLATMSQEERSRKYIETAVDDFIADIIHQYQWGELKSYGHSERNFDIVDDLDMTEMLILETLECKLDIPYQFQIDENMFLDGSHVKEIKII